MTVRHPTLCAACVHLRGPGRVCEAFPGGIPQAIYLFGADHREHRRGDHGITFELAPGEHASQALAYWQHVNEPTEGGGVGGNQAAGG